MELFFLFLTLGAAVFSIEQAKWISPQPYLTLMLLLSIALVWLLVSLRLPGWVLHLTVIGAGILVVLWQGVMILPAGSGVNGLFSIFASWWGGSGLQEADGKIIFGTLLVIVTWLSGYLSAWFVLRRNNPWAGVLAGLVILIVNLSNLPAKNFLFFAFFIIAAVLLIVQANVVRRQTAAGYQTNYSGKSLFYLTLSLCVIAALALSISWATPQLRLSALQNAIASGMPWKSSVQDSEFNILNSVHSKTNVSTASRLQTLEFGIFWNMGDDIKYVVVSPQPAYWQVNVYEEYTSDSWISAPGVEDPLEKMSGWGDHGDLPGWTRVKFEVTPGMNTDVVLLTGDFVSADMPVIARRSIENEITGVKAPRVLSPGEKYAVRVYVADNSAEALSTVSANYTPAIESAYLQLPARFPQKVRELSANITENATTPYDKVIAIDNYLAGIPYSLEVAPVPEGADAVEDFLFTQKKGFCLHYASAMAVMLRSVGVPARLAVGYLPGDPGREKGTYILRDKHYHAWTQVYFHGYGWIDFEPTPSGTSGSQVDLETPLVSVPEIREFPTWDFWYFPPGYTDNPSQAVLPAATPVYQVNHGKLAFSGELGWALIIITGIAGVLGLLFLLSRVIRPVYNQKLWNVDRENLAASAYANLCRLAEMNHLVPVSQQTPREFSSHISGIIPQESQNLDLIIRAYQEKRFGPDKGRPGLYEEAEILKARVRVYNAMLQKKGSLFNFFWKR